MMSEIINDETLTMYVQESKEHLENIETDLLEIEQQGDDLDEELVNRVFRAAHSIKGGGGFLNLTNIKELSHRIENILDMVRHGQLSPSSSVISIVLEAFDYLGTLLDNVLESNDMDIADHVANLESIVSGQLDDDEQETLHAVKQITHPDVNVTFEITEFDFKQSGRNGKVYYIVEYDLLKDVHRKNITPLEILHNLEEGGVIIDIIVGISTVGNLEDDVISSAIPMYVLYASIIEPDLLPIVLDLGEDKVHVLEPDSALQSAEPVPQAIEPISTPAVEKISAPEPTQKAKTPQPAAQKKPASAKKATSPKGKAPSSPQIKTEATLRVNVAVLDQLMNRAGELVLARNQLVQSISTGEQEDILVAGQRLDIVTSELQETIMLTRMQPIGNIFNKFPRVLRELAKQLGKEIDLALEGKDVELDKTIIEALGDPLTHLVRNAADHGIELPEVRAKKGKRPQGQVTLRAHHESGQVIIEIQDDGKGIDPDKIGEIAVKKGLMESEAVQNMSDAEKVNLIMMAGFSAAEEVTEVSGRGVGMDVVKTNLDKLGGQVDIISEVDQGSCLRIKLPLTLAIIPSLLIMSSHERFAIPQVNVGELLRIPAAEVSSMIEKVGEAEILTLRGELIPLLQLNKVLQLKPKFYDQKSGTYKVNRRAQLADERLLSINDSDQDVPEPATSQAMAQELDERRHSRTSDVNIAIVQSGSSRYGLVVDELRDNIEIVVKPLGRHLKNSDTYAGATIMGDGHLALILDVAGLAHKAELRAIAETDIAAQKAITDKQKAEGTETQTVLLFRNGPQEYCAVPLEMVLRVEKINADEIEISGGKKVIKYRGAHLSIYALEEVAGVEPLEDQEELIVLVFSVAGHEFGLLAVPPLDAKEIDSVIDESTLSQPGIRGSSIIQGNTTLIIDIVDFMQNMNPEWFEDEDTAISMQTSSPSLAQDSDQTVLLVEDSDFFRHQVQQFFEEAGINTVTAEDGQIAWDYLTAHPNEITLVVTDIEMPVMDGFELSSKIKNHPEFSALPIIALTSLASEEDVAKGKEVGIDEYQLKMDKELLLTSVKQFLGR